MTVAAGSRASGAGRRLHGYERGGRRNGPSRGSAREKGEGSEERAGTHDAETVDAAVVSGKQSVERDLVK